MNLTEDGREMDKEVLCPRCEGKTVPKLSILKKENGDVRERKCSKCNKVLAAYLVKEADFMSSIRKFQN